MILISHRGNLDGAKPDQENTIEAIDRALELGLDVEIDVWAIEEKLYLGHDNPSYPIEIKYLINNHLWCHAKNIESLLLMKQIEDIHYFWHETDCYTLTSKGYIWSYTGMPTNISTICVLPELYSNSKYLQLDNSLGICSDYVLRYKGLIL